MSIKKLSQNKIILRHLEKQPITLLDALMKYSVFNLSARINELRSQGYYIETVYRTDADSKKTYAEYRLGGQDAR